MDRRQRAKAPPRISQETDQRLYRWELELGKPRGILSIQLLAAPLCLAAGGNEYEQPVSLCNRNIRPSPPKIAHVWREPFHLLRYQLRAFYHGKCLSSI